MKVVGINGSPRKEGNTSILFREVFRELEKHGIETELIQIGGTPIRGCKACYTCAKTKDKKCVFKDDLVNECIEKLTAADGIILGSPTYFTDVTSEMKAFIDRVGFVSKFNGDLFKHKAGAAIVSVRRGGSIHTFDTMNHFLHYMQMFLVGGSYWNMVYGREIGEVENDKEGMLNMKVIGENMAWLLDKICKSKS
ncbi:MAG: flavodoxin family protein [Firmicutes bacterium HGW-Firmicutes-12]|jgi:multimeric flavodoxin WrbA|nr:MAG: flavodoxin family protein [Firmicutes bacterium HGW-Firmicutes-12]